MKTLIFGIDGLGKESLEGLGLKRLEKRINQGVFGNPAIQNIISRGWPELYTGKDAYQTGGFYQVPEYRDGKIRPTQRTGLSEIKKLIGNDELLWNRLNMAGHKVGVFTVPTITKPEKIDGFCIGATGAGKYDNELSDEDVYPRNLLQGLYVKNADLGFRMGYGAYIPNSIEDLEKSAYKHIADYFYILERVLDKYPVDICFAATRFINEMGYKFLGLCLNVPENAYEEKLKHSVMALCEHFDAKLDNFIEGLSPDHLFIVSDHGLAKVKYELNLNQFLVEMGILRRRSSFLNWKEATKPMYFWCKRNLFGRKIGNMIPKYDLENGDLFSIGFTNVLYLRDHRFGGQENSLDKQAELVSVLVNQLNGKNNELGFEHLIRFEESGHFGEIGQGSLKRALPNIICHMVPGIFNSERQFQVIKQKNFAFDQMFRKGFYGEHSGCKSEDTIAAYVGNKEGDIDFSRLTSIYESIIQVSEIKHG